MKSWCVGLSLLVSLVAEAGSFIPSPEKTGTPPEGTVNYQCEVDSDCVPKNVGNCCGYFPQCVHRDSPVFPEKVKAQCLKEGRSSVCGFEEVTSCVCRQHRCESVRAKKGEFLE